MRGSEGGANFGITRNKFFALSSRPSCFRASRVSKKKKADGEGRVEMGWEVAEGEGV